MEAEHEVGAISVLLSRLYSLHEFSNLREREMKHFLSKNRSESSFQFFMTTCMAMSTAFELQLQILNIENEQRL